MWSNCIQTWVKHTHWWHAEGRFSALCHVTCNVVNAPTESWPTERILLSVLSTSIYSHAKCWWASFCSLRHIFRRNILAICFLQHLTMSTRCVKVTDAACWKLSLCRHETLSHFYRIKSQNARCVCWQCFVCGGRCVGEVTTVTVDQCFVLSVLSCVCVHVCLWAEDSQVLTLHNISRRCSDTYECIADNGVPPSVSRRMRVIVECQ